MYFLLDLKACPKLAVYSNVCPNSWEATCNDSLTGGDWVTKKDIPLATKGHSTTKKHFSKEISLK